MKYDKKKSLEEQLERAVKLSVTCPELMINIQVVVAWTGISRSQIYLKTKEGTFPQPTKLSERASRWRAGDVRSFIDQRAAA